MPPLFSVFLRLGILFALGLPTLSAASETSEISVAKKGRAFRAGPSIMRFQDSEAFAGYGQSGYGLATLYEFVLNPRFSLGIDLTYRMISGDDQRASQLGYGLIMKHNVGAGDWNPYIAYGLLLQVIRLEGVEGDGTAHDTKLCAGIDIYSDWYVEASYHISRMRFFNTNAIRLDYLEANGGYVWRW